MTKKLLFLVAVSGLIFANNGCTSKKADDEQQVVENADIEKIEADGLGAPQGSDASLESALGETPTPSPSDSGASSAPTIEDSSLSLDTADTPAPTTDTPPPLDSSAPTLTETPIPPTEASSVDTAALAASLGSPTDTGTTDSGVTTSKPASSSIKKVSTTMPYQGKDGAWINTVYIARPKEKLADISMKIFGSDKTADLKKITENSYLKSRSVKAGDKIYYTSPNRPDDSTKTMLYYEDMGMVPEIYVAKKGENLKKISKELLGYDNAWREVWASNSMESKTSLKDGETIRYWKSADGATLAAAPPSGTATLMDASQAPQPTAQIEPPAALPPPPTDANANLPPPPADQVAAATAGTDGSAGLPPPPPADLAPPPPPPPDAAADEPKKRINLDEAAAAEGTGELDSDTMMSMGALGVLVAMMAFVIIRKKKQKAQMMSGEMNA